MIEELRQQDMVGLEGAAPLLNRSAARSRGEQHNKARITRANSKGNQPYERLSNACHRRVDLLRSARRDLWLR